MGREKIKLQEVFYKFKFICKQQFLMSDLKDPQKIVKKYLSFNVLTALHMALVKNILHVH